MTRLILTQFFSLLSLCLFAQLDFNDCFLGNAFRIRDAIPADFTNDGLPDLVMMADDETYILINSTSGFIKLPLVNIVEPRNIKIGDLNNDGNLDIVIVANETNSLKILESDGNPIPDFILHEYNFGDFPNGLTLADINDDSLIDLIIGFGGAARNVHLINNGDFSLSKNEEFNLPPDFANSLIINDFNNDGLNDIFLTSFGDSLFTYINDGSSLKFTQKFLVEQNAALESTAADFNNDGLVDIIISTLYDGLIMLKQTDDGYVKEVIDSTLISSIAVTSGDLDNDGDLEIILSENAEKLIYYDNNNGTFIQNIITFSGINGNTISVYDYDSDNDLDLLTSNYFQGEYRLFKNQLLSSLKDQIAKTEISIYPNPSRTSLHVDTDLNIQSINLFNMSGHQVLSSPDALLDIHKLSPGSYIIDIQTDTGSYKQVVVKY